MQTHVQLQDLEFEMIFTVLDISFSKDQLRKLISLTDTNQDGKIDVKEFHKMLYAEDIEATQAAKALLDDDIEVLEEESNESDGDEAELGGEA